MSADEDSPHYWLGYLSASINAIATDEQVPREQRKQARKDLDRFLSSPAATEELAQTLKVKP